MLSFSKTPNKASEDLMPIAGKSPAIVLDTESEKKDNEGKEEEGDKSIQGEAEKGEQEDLSPDDIMIINLAGEEEKVELECSGESCNFVGEPSCLVLLA